MITLRPNQSEAIDQAVRYLRTPGAKPALIVLPTAWGKSILTAFVAKQLGEKLLVLQPSKELLEQNYQKYLDLAGDDPMLSVGVYSASYGSKTIGQVTYATIGSIKNLGEEFRRQGFTRLLIDEAHLYPRESDSMLGRFLKDSKITSILGITATPIKLQNYRSLTGDTYSKLVMLTSRTRTAPLFRDIIHVAQVDEMVRLGYWSTLVYEAQDFDHSLLRYNGSRSEFTDASILAAHVAAGGVRSVTDALAAHPERKHVLIFVPSVAEARELAESTPNAGVIYGDQDKQERAETIARFRAGELRVIYNVRVLSTGFDYTGIDCIILGISTASIALYYQIVGRGTRIHPDKKDCLIVDLGGNFERFGRVEDLRWEIGRQWRLFGSGGRLLSGIPMHEIGLYTREDVARVEQEAAAIEQDPTLRPMPWGKHAGTPIRDLPLHYRRWLLANLDFSAPRNRPLLASINASLASELAAATTN